MTLYFHFIATESYFIGNFIAIVIRQISCFFLCYLSVNSNVQYNTVIIKRNINYKGDWLDRI